MARIFHWHVAPLIAKPPPRPEIGEHDGDVPAGGVIAWVDDRLGLGGLRYPVPAHANRLAFTLGGMATVTLAGLVVTGIYLAQFYDPTPLAAHNSVTYIMDSAFAGELLRSMHVWLSSAFVVLLAAHLLRTFITAAFKAPRELTWITGVLLFVVTAALLFSGTVLKQDQEAVEALAHNRELADTFGFAGFWFSPDFTDSVPIVTRLYVAHVSILPTAMLMLLVVHMLLIKRHRMAPLPWGSPADVTARDAAEHRGPFTEHIRHIALYGSLVIGACLVLSGLLPSGLGPAGVEGIEITKPPWYFLWLYPFEDWFGLNALWAVPALIVTFLVAVPFLDRGPERDPRRRPAWMVLVAVAVVAWVVLSVMGAVSVPVSHTGMGG